MMTVLLVSPHTPSMALTGKPSLIHSNSDAACISEEYDGEGHVAWDEWRSVMPNLIAC
jgi:hypothetical protein